MKLTATFARASLLFVSVGILIAPIAVRADGATATAGSATASSGPSLPAASSLPPLTLPPAAASAVAKPPVAERSVFNWRDIPQGQRVTITRATFDGGGYQLFDTVGETIVVPFANNNLYVMKFVPTDDARMIFVNDAGTPILYVPEGGYLENAAADDARWYPFSPSFHPATPVFLGIAPSWHAYVGMGWYPGMVCYAGYYCDGPWAEDVAVYPAFSYGFVIGGRYLHGWDEYGSYCFLYATPYHARVFDYDYYRFGDRPWVDRHADMRPDDHRFLGFSGDRDAHYVYTDRGFSGHTGVDFLGEHGFSRDGTWGGNSGFGGFSGSSGAGGYSGHSHWGH